MSEQEHGAAYDSSVDGVATTDDAAISAAAELIEEAQRVMVVTGAGISTDSGIPDFRGPKGVWTRDPEAEKKSHIQYYLTEAEVRQQRWRGQLDSPVWGADPNPGHFALVNLERRRKLAVVVTQNVDGLHQESGIKPEKVVEMHGHVKQTSCWNCSYAAPTQEVLDRVRMGESDPACPICGGILKTDTISFGQNLVMEDIQRAQTAAEECDLVLAVGTLLYVFPAASVVPVAKSNGARIVIVNGEPTEMDGLSDVVIMGSISKVLPQIC